MAAFDGQVGQEAYAASKGGVAALTLPAARELARFGVRVAVLGEGEVLDILELAFAGAGRADVHDMFELRFGSPRRRDRERQGDDPDCGKKAKFLHGFDALGSVFRMARISRSPSIPHHAGV